MGLRIWWRHRKRRQQIPPRTWERTMPAVPTSTPSPASLDEDGRRHRDDVPYLLPKDMQEVQRLDYQHYIIRQILQGNTFAPVHDLLRNASQVLDMGCGTGRWGYEIASTYPQTQVSGLDVEDVPRTTSTPLNYAFVKGNIFDCLPFGPNTFHYTHQRLLVAGIPFERWPWVMGELCRVTQPGGWIEMTEMGNTFHQAGPATKQFLAWWTAISASRGIDAACMSQLGPLLTRAGLSSIATKTATIPVGTWGGRLGNLMAHNMLAGWPTMRPYAHSLLGVEPETFDEMLAHLEHEKLTQARVQREYERRRASRVGPLVDPQDAQRLWRKNRYV